MLRLHQETKKLLNLNYMKYFLKCWKHYADFKGRARRKEYWMFLLFSTIISTILTIALNIAQVVEALNSPDGNPFKMIREGQMFNGSDAVSIIFCIILAYGMASLLPTLAVVVRRLHDIGRKGTWILLLLVPTLLMCIFYFNMFSLAIAVGTGIAVFVVNIALTVLYIVLGCIDGQKGENQYGPNPKEVEEMNN